MNCATCQKTPRDVAFRPNRNKCRPCERTESRAYGRNNRKKRNARLSRWRKANPQKASAIDRRKRLAGYGLTEADLNEMNKTQNAQCRLYDRRVDLVIDHCPQDFNAKFGGDIYVVTGEHQRTAFFSKAAAEQYLAKQDPERFKIVVYAKPVGEQRELTAQQAEKIDEIISRHKTNEFDSFHAADDLSDYLFGGVNYPGIFATARGGGGKP